MGLAKKFEFWVHGLASAGSGISDWAPNSSFWTSACSAGQQMTVLPNASVHNAVMWGTVDYVLGDIAHWIAMGPAWDPNSPKPKPRPQKPHPKEKWYAKFVDEEEMHKRDMASAKYYALGRRMEEEERQLSGAETMADVKNAVLFEEELMNTPLPKTMTKNRTPKKFTEDPKFPRGATAMGYGEKFEKYDFKKEPFKEEFDEKKPPMKK